MFHIYISLTKNPLMSVMHVNLICCIQPCFQKVAVHCDTDDKIVFSDKKMTTQNKDFPLQCYFLERRKHSWTKTWK